MGGLQWINGAETRRIIGLQANRCTVSADISLLGKKSFFGREDFLKLCFLTSLDTFKAFMFLLFSPFFCLKCAFAQHVFDEHRGYNTNVWNVRNLPQKKSDFLYHTRVNIYFLETN